MPFRTPLLTAVVLLFAASAPALAQEVVPPPAAPAAVAPRIENVQTTQLAAPDAFSTPGRDTGLAPSLWSGASLQTAKTVLPLLAAKPLSPAAAALARRLLATGAPGPQGVGPDPDLAAVRANALMFQGDPKAAAAVLAHAPGLDRSATLALAAAEAALLSGDEARACRIADGLTVGRDETYWLKLRAFCQAIAGQSAQAQLTFDLVQAQAKDPAFTRLMGAKLAGAGNPGAVSLRNGLDYALSKSLGLDLAVAKPSPAVAAALANVGPAEPAFEMPAASPDLADLAVQVREGRPVAGAALIGVAAGHLPAASMLVLALGDDTTPRGLEFLAQSPLPEGKAPLGRDLAMDAASRSGRAGQAAMLALWTCAEAGAAGPSISDRVRIVRALHAAGLDRDARNFVLEGLASLK